MKNRFHSHRQFIPALTVTCSLLACTACTRASTIIKAATGTELNDPVSWEGGVAPTSADLASWNATSLGAGLSLSANAAWLGIAASSTTAGIGISGIGGLTLGASGVNVAGTNATPTTIIPLTLDLPLVLGADQTWSANNGFGITATGAISGGGALTFSGDGTNTLAGANSYTGGTTLLGGTITAGPGATLALGHANALGSGTLALKSNRTGSNETLFLAGGITLTNPITIDTASGREGITSVSGNNTLSGAITVTGSTANHIYFKNNGESGSVFTIASPITGLTMNSTEGIGLRGLAGNFGVLSGQITTTGFLQINGAATWTVSSTGNSWNRTIIQGPDGGFILGADDALATTARLSFGNDTNGSLDLAGFNQTLGGLDFAANPNSKLPKVGNSSTARDSLLKINGGGYTFIGALVDTLGGGDKKLALELLSGEQTLSGFSNYTGTTTISGGTLRVNGSLGASPVTVKTAATLTGSGTLNGPVTVNSGGSLTAGNVGGTGALTLASLTLGATAGDTQTINIPATSSGINVFGALTTSGTTTLKIPSATGLTTGLRSLVLYNGPPVTSGFAVALPLRVLATLVYSASAIDLDVTSTGDSIKWTGANGPLWNTADENWQLVTGGTTTKYLDGSPGDVVLFDETLAGNPDIALNSQVSPASVTFNSTTNYSLSGTGGIAGTGGITKSNIGKLTLNNSNTFTGAVSVAAGVVEIRNATALGSTAAGTTVASGAALQLAGGISVAGEALTIGGGGEGATNTGALRNISGDNSWSANIGLTGSTRFTCDSGSLTVNTISGTNRLLVLNGAGNITINGAITTGTGGLSMDNLNGTGPAAGIVTLNGVNTNTGAVSVGSGTLNLTANRTTAIGALSVGSAGTTATLNIGGNLPLATGNNFVGSGAGGIGVINQTAGTTTFAAATILYFGSAGVVGNINTATYNLSGGVLGSATSTGVISLGVNSYSNNTFNLGATGVLNLPAGSLHLGRTNRNDVKNTVNTFNQTGGTATVASLIVGGNNNTTGGAAVDGIINLSGGIFSATSFPNFAAGYGNNSTITIGGTAVVTLPAIPTVRGTDSTATMTFNGGTLRPAATSTAYISGLTNAYLAANGANFEVATGNDITIPQLLGNAPSQAGTLSKSGPGKLTLTGPNTYSGGTTVHAGVLATNGTALADSAKLVINGGKVEAAGVEVVNTLYFGAAQQAAGTYGATGSGAGTIDDVHFTGTGQVSVVSGPGYSTWADLYAPGQTADQDHDNDGMKNGVEYFMGATGSNFTASPAPVNGKVTWPKDPAFIGSYFIQTSATLTAGDWTNVPVNGTNPKDTGTSVEYTLPTGQGKLFTRLQVTPN